MSFGERIRGILGKNDYDEYDEYEYDDEDNSIEQNNQQNPTHVQNSNNNYQQPKLRSVKGGLSEMEIINFALLNYQMTAEVFEYIKSKQPAIVNMEKLESPDAQRALDYLSGATKALGGSVEKVAESIFLFAPEHVKIYPTKNANVYNQNYNMPNNLSSGMSTNMLNNMASSN